VICVIHLIVGYLRVVTRSCFLYPNPAISQIIHPGHSNTTHKLAIMNNIRISQPSHFLSNARRAPMIPIRKPIMKPPPIPRLMRLRAMMKPLP